MNDKEIEELKKENRTLRKTLQDKREIIQALVEHLQTRYKYNKKSIFNIVESFKNRQ